MNKFTGLALALLVAASGQVQADQHLSEIERIKRQYQASHQIPDRWVFIMIGKDGWLLMERL